MIIDTLMSSQNDISSFGLLILNETLQLSRAHCCHLNNRAPLISGGRQVYSACAARAVDQR